MGRLLTSIKNNGKYGEHSKQQRPQNAPHEDKKKQND